MKTHNLLLVGACCVAFSAFAQPAAFNYQAKLTDSVGAPLQGPHTMYFSLFEGGSEGVANDGVLLFKESASVGAVNGIVSHAVGTGANLMGGVPTSAMLQTPSDVFLQVAVDADIPSA